MFPYKRSGVFLSFAVLLTSLTACAGSPSAKNLEESLAADPRLQNNPVTLSGATQSTGQNNPTVQLPTDFPTEIPRYPNAQLEEVAPTSTRWVSVDPSNLIEGFYLNQFRANQWEILRQPSNEQPGILEARRNDLLVSVSVKPAPIVRTPNPTPTPTPNSTPNQPPPATEFVIQYQRNAGQAAQATPGVTPETTPPSETTGDAAPQPGSPEFIGPIPPSDFATQPGGTANPPAPNSTTATPGLPATTLTAQVFSDINKAPQQLQPYIQDLAALGVLSVTSDNTKSNATPTVNLFEPGKTITRREYARWLVAANNALHANNSAKQIRLAAETAQPAFSDVSAKDPDFPAIQGLAEAGLISSPLSGNSTAVLFRPDAPLTREMMLLWKVPLDTRQALPSATLDSVRQTWGFQDVARIDSQALRAVLADFQMGEVANIRRVFGFTTLFQPKRPVTRAEAVAALWYFGSQGEGISAKEALKLQRPQN